MADYDPLDLIERYESGGRNVPNYRYDPGHTAGGFWQITDTNWRNLAPGLGIDLGQYPNAMSAPKPVQRQVAETLFEKHGWSPWAPFNPALNAAIGGKGTFNPPMRYDPEFGREVPVIEINKPPPDNLAGMYLLSKLMGGQAVDEPQAGQDDGMALLTSLMGPPGQPPEGTQSSEATDTSQELATPLPPAAAPTVDMSVPTQATPIQPVGQGAPPTAAQPQADPGRTLLDRLLAGINPIGSAQAAEGPISPQPGTPPAAPTPRPEDYIEPPPKGFAPPPPPSVPTPPPQAERQAGMGILQRLMSGIEAAAPEAAMAGAGGQLAPPDLSAATGMPSALERSAQISAERPYKPGMTAGQMMGPSSQEDPVLYAVGTGSLGRGPGFIGKPATTAVGRGTEIVRKTINEIFSPTTVDPTSLEAESVIRQSTGLARRETAAAGAAVEPHRALVNAHIPEFDAWMRAKKAGLQPPGKPGLLRFLDFVEGRSRGAKYDGPPELRPLADELQRLYRERRVAIEAEPTTAEAAFIEDYYSHMWQERETVRAASAAGGQGSGRSLKQRKIPTISEGIQLGYTPVTLDPIEMTMRYVANMDRYLAHNRTFRISHEAGIIQFHPGGAQPEGWTQLQGRMAERGMQKAYAPEAFARVYNNAISSGVYADRLGGQVYNAILKTKNTLNGFVLGLSGYHAAAMAQEASASALARAIGAVTDADIAGAAKQLGLGGMPVAKSVSDVMSTGRKLQRQYLRVDDYGADYEKVAKLLAEGGGRIVGRGQEWRGTAADNFFKSWQRGALKIEMFNAGREIAQSPWRAPLVAAREIARLNDTIMAPIFDGMIPRLKGAAFFDEMSAWLKTNPEADRTAQLAKSRQLIDVIDDRFGEMILDNIFWGKRTKQFLQLATTSLGWELGTMRSGLGAAADVARGQWTPRIRYLMGLAGAVALYNASYEYLMTGKGPQGPGDLVTARTGGTTPEEAPERALLPGYEKDALGWWHSPTTEFANKLSPAGRLGGELITGKDYFGHEIAPFAPFTPDWFKAYGGHIIGAMTPIPLKSEFLKGTNIGMGQRLMGVRPAPEYIQNPQRFDDMETRRRLGNLRGELRGLYAHGARTQEDRAAIEKKAAEIRRRIQKTTEDAARRKKERGPPEPRQPVF